MKTYVQLLALACLVAVAGTAHAQPGTVFLKGSGGAMIPVGTFHHQQNPGGAYSIAAGYEMVDFLDLMLEFTQSFNDIDNLHFSGPGFTASSDEVAQTFIVSGGPRINFVPSDFPVRPYMLAQVGWYHFAHFNSIEIDGVRILGDDDEDNVGVQGGLGLEATVLQLYERRGDKYPLLEVTLGVEGIYHQAFAQGSDKQFVTTMGSLGVRF